MQNQFPPPQRVEQRTEVQGRKRIDQSIGPGQADLNQAELFRVCVQAVGFGVQRNPVGRLDLGNPARELFFAVNHRPSKTLAGQKTKVDCEKSVSIQQPKLDYSRRNRI